MIELEVCVDTAEGLMDAVDAGADRIELCGPLSIGGITPSFGLMRLAARFSVPVLAMIRPRAGGFVFSAAEEAIMLDDIDAAREAGVAGVVLGASCHDHRLDEAMLARLVERAEGMDLTLHRAFDVVPKPLEALETAIKLGFSRILTSGMAVKAPDGCEVLAELVRAAAGRIQIMAGSGVTAKNAAEIVEKTAVTAVHASCRLTITPWGNVPEQFGFGALPHGVDEGVVRAMKAAILRE